MVPKTAAQTAFGPMMLAALEQYEPPGRRLVDDDLARDFLPARMRWLVAALRWAPLRHLLIAASERTGPGLLANLTCRKHFIGDQLAASLGEIDAVVILGAGLDTRAYHLTPHTGMPIFEVDQPVNIARKQAAVRRVVGTVPRSVRMVPVNFEHDDLLTALAEHGYRPDFRTFFIWEGVTQYLTEDAVRATLEGLRPVAPGSRLVFTFVRRDFIDGTNLYGVPPYFARRLRQLWHFGLQPEEVQEFLAPYGWWLQEQLGPEQIRQRYIEPTGRTLAASELEWSAYAEKQ